jgi:hypothetical protein
MTRAPRLQRTDNPHLAVDGDHQIHADIERSTKAGPIFISPRPARLSAAAEYWIWLWHK